MGNCKSCKYWKVKDEDMSCKDIIKPSDPDSFKPMKMPWEVRFCTSPDLLFFERPVAPNQACVIDGSEYMAKLITGPDYGCPNFRLKMSKEEREIAEHKLGGPRMAG